MKRFLALLLVFSLCACAPVIRRDIAERSIVNVPFTDIVKNPDYYRGKLIMFGGKIVETRITEQGSLIEAIYIQADSRGNLKSIEPTSGRFLALFPREKGILDPIIYKKNREVTIAGEFMGFRSGKLDGMEYNYPSFDIKAIHLWEERRYYYMSPPYPAWYYPYPTWWYDPWVRPSPFFWPY